VLDSIDSYGAAGVTPGMLSLQTQQMDAMGNSDVGGMEPLQQEPDTGFGE
jgi:hypothetical protein